VTEQELRTAVGDPDTLASRSFEVLGELAALALEDVGLARELVIRALEHRTALGPDRVVLDAFVRHSGLFPYLDTANLAVSDAIAYETHRPLGLPGDIVFHTVQAHVYRALLAGDDVVLTAPTSFGKTLIIDALISSGRYTTVIIVVPTIALIDETRVRLAGQFRDRFKLVTHAGQGLGEHNLIVMTQERVLEIDRDRLPKIDLLVIDEFYKLDPHMDPERASLLNQAFDRLRRRARQLYLLGPNVRGLSPRLPSDFTLRHIATDFTTVAVDVMPVHVPARERPRKLVEICREHRGQTLIYCRAPRGCRRVATILDDAGLGTADDALRPAADWIAEHIHPDWIVGRLLARRIGIHHAQMPRWLSQFIVRAFNAGELDYLICTSTLIEGVNTTAKNVVIYENKVGPKDLDAFTFANISGRSGRMRAHLVGRVFHFHPRPSGELQTVDIPILSQSEDASESLLLELPDDELNSTSRDRLRPLLEQDLLPADVLRAHPGVPPDRQLKLAEVLAEDPEFYEGDLAWEGFPTEYELRAVCELIWDNLVAARGQRNGIANGRQLAARLNRFRADADVTKLIEEELRGDYAADADDAVESVMQFIRSWADFEFPKLLRCLDAIQRVILGRAGSATGDYAFFAAHVEGLFAEPFLAALDEYGIPLEVARRLHPALGRPSSFDELLEALRALELSQTPLSEFERTLVADARRRL
jgi:DEAD/DEAH box helicase/Helicase conserved C-terminal domain